jgi:sulfite reductase alpha subunit-like flavoprotein
MARDVDRTLHQIIENQGKSREEAGCYVQALKEDRRYQRDVY